jgi:hypothetical protein
MAMSLSIVSDGSETTQDWSSRYCTGAETDCYEPVGIGIHDDPSRTAFLVRHVRQGLVGYLASSDGMARPHALRANHQPIVQG